MAGFYLRDEKHKTISGADIEHKGVLYFKLEKAGFDGVATKDHVKNYALEFNAFLHANPKYKLPGSFSDVEIGQPVSVVVAPEVKAEAPKVEEVKKEPVKKDK